MPPLQTEIQHDLVKNRPRYDQTSLERFGIEGFQQVIKLRERRFRRLRLFFLQLFNEALFLDMRLGIHVSGRSQKHPQDLRKVYQRIYIVQGYLNDFFITRSLSRCHWRSFIESRLSCSCLPFATPISNFAHGPFQYNFSGIMVYPVR